MAAGLLGWQEGLNFTLHCFGSLNQILDDLLSPDGICDAAATGLTITTARQAQGLVFSYPTYRSSLGIMLQASSDSAPCLLRPLPLQVLVPM